MISKKIIKDEESLKKIQAGVNKLNDAVKNSLGIVTGKQIGRAHV